MGYLKQLAAGTAPANRLVLLNEVMFSRTHLLIDATDVCDNLERTLVLTDGCRVGQRCSSSKKVGESESAFEVAPHAPAWKR